MSFCMLTNCSGPPGGGHTLSATALARRLGALVETLVGPDVHEARDRAASPTSLRLSIGEIFARPGSPFAPQLDRSARRRPA